MEVFPDVSPPTQNYGKFMIAWWCVVTSYEVKMDIGMVARVLHTHQGFMRRFPSL